VCTKLTLSVKEHTVFEVSEERKVVLQRKKLSVLILSSAGSSKPVYVKNFSPISKLFETEHETSITP
jgi:hypothetical protein